MKKHSLFLGLCTLFASLSLQAQNPVGGNLYMPLDTSGIKFSQNPNTGYIGIGLTTPTSTLHLMDKSSANTTLTLSRYSDGTLGTAYGTTALVMSGGASFSQSVFPSYGDAALNIANTAGDIVLTPNSTSHIYFGSLPGAGVGAGKYNFDNLLWTNQGVISAYNSPGGSSYTLPSGYIFGVNGSANFVGAASFNSSLTAGSVSSGSITTSSLQVNGNTTITGAAVVNGTSTFNAFVTANKSIEAGYFVSAGGGSNSFQSAGAIDGIQGPGFGYAGYFQGAVIVTGTFSNPSDIRIKKDLKPVTGALSRLNSLKSYNYLFDRENYPKMKLPEGRQYGVIAQDMQQVFPELVTNNTSIEQDSAGHKETTTTLGVNYIGLIPILLSAINELSSQVDSLKNVLGGNSAARLSQTAFPTTTSQSSLGSLDQNSPNPFSENTTISFTVNEGVVNAQLKIISVDSGNEIKSYTITSRGRSQITISANELTSGMYIYQLLADGKSIGVKKMILLD